LGACYEEEVHRAFSSFTFCLFVMRLVVGLGNPGAQHAWTRHNLGFMLIDLLARETGAPVKRQECRALVGRALLEGERVELVKPQTYMNLSGEAVACLVSKHELRAAVPGSLIVISDDLALPFGVIRLRVRGSAGGHNGLKSIIGALGTDEFIRLRIGIQPEHPVSDTSRFVLDEFPQSVRTSVEEVLERSADALRAILRDGIDKAMAQYNSNQ
jgi:PTH1 family peptidyl-tRNA hydrolase